MAQTPKAPQRAAKASDAVVPSWWGRAPKKTAAKRRDWGDFALRFRGNLFAHYAAIFQEPQPFHEFAMREAQLGFGLTWSKRLGAHVRLKVGAMMLLEGLRSASPGSLIGIDRNSYVFRFRRAWGFGRISAWGWSTWELRFGLIPEPWVDVLQQHYALRGLSQILVEHAGMHPAGDLGVELLWRVWGGFAELRGAMTNGEGVNMIEQNGGKNITGTLILRPWRGYVWGSQALLALYGTVRDGSQGTAFAKNHRYGGGLTFSHDRFGLGLEATAADGYLGRGDIQALAIGTWAHADVWPRWLGLYLRFEHWNTDTSLDDATRMRLLAGIYFNALWMRFHGRLQRMQLYVGYQYTAAGANAGPTPGVPTAVESHQIMILLAFMGDVEIHLGKGRK